MTQDVLNRFVMVDGYMVHTSMIAERRNDGVTLHDGRVFNHRAVTA
jgi:hypothetical protein